MEPEARCGMVTPKKPLPDGPDIRGFMGSRLQWHSSWFALSGDSQRPRDGELVERNACGWGMNGSAAIRDRVYCNLTHIVSQISGDPCPAPLSWQARRAMLESWRSMTHACSRVIPTGCAEGEQEGRDGAGSQHDLYGPCGDHTGAARSVGGDAALFRGNLWDPSSIHGVGRRAATAVAQAWRTLSEKLGAKPAEVIFTSGGTEGANAAMHGIAWARVRQLGRTGSSLRRWSTKRCWRRRRSCAIATVLR